MKDFLWQLWGLAKPSTGQWMVLLALVIIGELLVLPGTFLIAMLIDRIHVGGAEGFIVFYGFTVVVLLALRSGLGVIQMRLNRRLALGAANGLRRRFFNHVLHLPYPFFLEHQAAGQANALLNDIDDVDKSLEGFVENGLRSVVTIVVFGAALTIWNPVVGGIALVLLPLTVLGQRSLRRRVHVVGREKVDQREAMVATVAESVAAYPVVKSFTMEAIQERRINDRSHGFADAQVVMETIQSILRSSAAILLIGTQFAFIIIGALMALNGQISLGAYVGQVWLVGALTTPLNTLLEFGNQLSQSRAALHRVNDILALDREDTSGERTETLIPTDSPAIVTEGFAFRYRPDIPLIRDWQFTVNPGETVALVGPSGCGKTTFLQILVGMFTNYEGSCRIHGKELRSILLPSLREHIGVVFQEQILIQGTIRENLRVGADEDVEDDLLWDALRRAHALDFVRELPEGLDTRVGPGGLGLSGGQRQRLSIARVILKNPPILLLDEATSALDSFSEAHLQAALDDLLHSRTSIVVAHRLSTITNADRIIVLDEGHIIQSGTHEELVNQEGIYKDLHAAQVEGFLSWNRDSSNG